MNFKDGMYIFFNCYKEIIIIVHAILLTFRNTKHLGGAAVLPRKTLKHVTDMHKMDLVLVGHLCFIFLS